MIRHQHVSGMPTPRNAMTKDHVEPRVYGGETSFTNLIAACCQCNQLRGEMDAVAFKNLIKKWFKRDARLRVHWHSLSSQEISSLKLRCLQVHEEHLRGKARRHIEFGFRHYDFTFRERRRLSA